MAIGNLETYVLTPKGVTQVKDVYGKKSEGIQRIRH